MQESLDAEEPGDLEAGEPGSGRPWRLEILANLEA